MNQFMEGFSATAVLYGLNPDALAKVALHSRRPAGMIAELVAKKIQEVQLAKEKEDRAVAEALVERAKTPEPSSTTQPDVPEPDPYPPAFAPNV